MTSSLVRHALILTMACCAVAACAAAPPPPPPPPKATLALAARADVNPDASGRASPVVMRVYQLKTDSSFARAEFFNLFDDDRKALGADLIARDEYELIPGESKALELAPSGDARFLGAVAAFHDVRNSTWRAVLAVPKTGLGNSRINVIAAKTGIRIELGH